MSDQVPSVSSFDESDHESFEDSGSMPSLQRVLLVTDRVRERHVLMSALDSLPVATAFASSQADALRLGDALRPDVIALDIELEGEGWATCDALLERVDQDRKAVAESASESEDGDVDGASIPQWEPAFILLHGEQDGVEEQARSRRLDRLLRWPFAVEEARSLFDLVLADGDEANGLPLFITPPNAFEAGPEEASGGGLFVDAAPVEDIGTEARAEQSQDSEPEAANTLWTALEDEEPEGTEGELAVSAAAGAEPGDAEFNYVLEIDTGIEAESHSNATGEVGSTKGESEEALASAARQDASLEDLVAEEVADEVDAVPAGDSDPADDPGHSVSSDLDDADNCPAEKDDSTGPEAEAGPEDTLGTEAEVHQDAAVAASFDSPALDREAFSDEGSEPTTTWPGQAEELPGADAPLQLEAIELDEFEQASRAEGTAAPEDLTDTQSFDVVDSESADPILEEDAAALSANVIELRPGDASSSEDDHADLSTAESGADLAGTDAAIAELSGAELVDAEQADAELASVDAVDSDDSATDGPEDTTDQQAEPRHDDTAVLPALTVAATYPDESSQAPADEEGEAKEEASLADLVNAIPVVQPWQPRGGTSFLNVDAEEPSPEDRLQVEQGAAEPEMAPRPEQVEDVKPTPVTEEGAEDLIDRLLVERDPGEEISAVTEIDHTPIAPIEVPDDFVLADSPASEYDYESGPIGLGQDALAPILSDLFNVDGVGQVMLVENEGGVVFTSSKTPQFSLSQLAEHSVQLCAGANLLLSGAEAAHEDDAGVQSIVVEGERGCVLLQTIDSRHRLVVCVENVAGLGQVRFLIRRLQNRLRRALGT